MSKPGPRSKALAICLHDWLKSVVQRANPWMSERDIDAGQRWSDQIATRLKTTHFGIICLTPDNLSAPWLLFEAGALAKALEVAHVVPVLLDVPKTDLTFPLAQFQAVEADREGFFSLVSALNRALGDEQLPATLLVNIFGGLWGTLDTALRKLPAAPSREKGSGHRTDRQLLEDVHEGVRILQRRINGAEIGTPTSAESPDWEDYYIRGVNFANSREGTDADLSAVRAYHEAIALAPSGLPDNMRSRLFAYRGATLKRLGRYEEALADLGLAKHWAQEKREVEDALYNLACIAALQLRRQDALTLLRELLSRDQQWAPVIATNKYFENLRNDAEFNALIMHRR
jgi:tetratricopeptide (TPR) repeat protein